MKFEVGDVVRLTKLGWENSFRRDPGISTGGRKERRNSLKTRKGLLVPSRPS